jgi:hypothetical protein
LAEIKNAVDGLSDAELIELATFIRRREDAAWDRQIDTDFAEGGRLRSVLDEVRADLRAGRVEELPNIESGLHAGKEYAGFQVC